MTQLKDDIDFLTLGADKWQDLCFQVLRNRNPDLKTVCGNGGDEGIDAYVGDFESPLVIYQFKYFRKGFDKPQKRQVESSLERALSIRSGFRWVLVCNFDPTPAAQRWFDDFKLKHSEVDMDFIFGSEMKTRLLNTPKVRKEYFPSIQDQIEYAVSTESNDPLKHIATAARMYNKAVIDDRFSAHIASNGDSETVVYSLKPGIDEEVPLFVTRPLSKYGEESLSALYREGQGFTLTPDDIEIEPRVDFLGDIVNFITLSAFSVPDASPSLLKLYSSKDVESAVSLTVELKTLREGEEIKVRSNAEQKRSPILIEFDLPQDMSEQSFSAHLEPRLVGNDVKTAFRGVCFLAQLAETRCMGIGHIDGDFDDVAFVSTDAVNASGSWEELKSILERVMTICQFFACNPVLDEKILDPEFIDSLMSFHDALSQGDERIRGTVRLNFESYDEDVAASMQESEPERFVCERDWNGNLFGIECSATIRTVIEGVPTFSKTEDGAQCTIQGEYWHYVFKKDD